ncbi:MAG: hypothetical protein ABUT20_55340, partial [Bacteroidota bacterium]
IMKMTKSDKSRLTEKQLKALPFLIFSRSAGDGRREAKISRQTYYEWLKEPIFKAELTRFRNLIVEDAIEVLKTHTTKAVNTLVGLLDANNLPLQRNVANDILQHVSKFKELQEIEARLEVLEKQCESKTNLGGLK